MIGNALAREAILEQLQRIVSSELFENAGRSRILLEFLVQESVNGRGEALKEYTIGSEALGRGPSFDPRTDTIVRAEASRLRSRLERYYAAEGQADPLIISLPKGGYSPECRERQGPVEAGALVSKSHADRRIARKALGALGTACLIGAGFWIWNHLSQPAERHSLTFEVELKTPGVVGSVVGTDVVVSPDGTRLVFVSQGTDGMSLLNVQRLDRPQTVELSGTEGARVPFFSPDGRWVGFWASGKLKKTPIEGGSPMVVCDAEDLLGASWGEDDFILASFGENVLYRIPASGNGPPAIALSSDELARVSWPQVLPGKQAVLFTVLETGGPEQARIEVLSLTDGKTKIVARGGLFARYLSAGYLTYVRQGTLYLAPFDLDRLETGGPAAPVIDGVSYDSTFGYAQLDFSRTGTLVYRRNSGAALQWLDSAGRTESIVAKGGQFVWPRLSPDGRQLAVTGTEGGVTVVWIYDVQTGQTRRAATGPRYLTLWSPDGQHLVLGGGTGLSWIRSNQPGTPQPLTHTDQIQIPASFTPDGNRLAYSERSPATHFDLWTVLIESSGGSMRTDKPEVFLQTPAVETYPMFSPDGRWMAYVSDETGVGEIYVRAFPDTGRSVQVSTAGGRVPLWSPNRRELFYRTHDHRIMVATYRAKGSEFIVEGVRQWSTGPLFNTGVLANFDVGPDGRVAALLPAEQPQDRQSQNHVTIRLNFFDEVQRLYSARQ